MDRRVARTKRLLAQALVELVNEQPYETITIRDITDRADIGYATYFRHYEGKDDLMLEVFTQIITDLESLHETRIDHSFEREGYLFFQQVADNRALYRSILDSRAFSRKLREHITLIVLDQIVENHADELERSEIPPEIAAHHLVSSLLGLADWWLSNDQSYTVVQMARFYERLVVQTTWHALGLSNTIAST
ncbi:MAG: TetR/AcrR family transcriptional regulator [Chloroflexi bacterium]|nr:TetR/AcrR family transcriptional regulator [Chloroflexota bacterium]